MKSVFSDEYLSLITGLRNQRKRLGITQRELSLRMGVTQSLISKIENRERRLDVIEYCSLAKLLGLDPFSFLENIINQG